MWKASEAAGPTGVGQQLPEVFLPGTGTSRATGILRIEHLDFPEQQAQNRELPGTPPTGALVLAFALFRKLSYAGRVWPRGRRCLRPVDASEQVTGTCWGPRCLLGTSRASALK
ncbi:hypothetical protein CB1_000672014 [Camelus ferus]|nr:hypothetical protein CB1_000672014 [Camelus ferus]